MNHDPSYNPEDAYEKSRAEAMMADAIKNSAESWENLPQIQCFVGPNGNGKHTLLTNSVEHYINTGRRELINLNGAMDSLVQYCCGDPGDISYNRRFTPALLRGSRDGGFYGNPEYGIWIEEIPHYVSDIRDALGERKKLICVSFSPAFIDCLLPSEVFVCAPTKTVVEPQDDGRVFRGSYISSMPIERLARFDKLFAEGYVNTEIIKKIGSDEITAQLKATSN